MATDTTPEVHPQASVIPPLNEKILHLAEPYMDKTFLHAAVSPDDEEMRRRVMEVQRTAYEKYPYPCIRAFHHICQFMSENPVYPEVLEAGKGGNTVFLDLGCCMGTDVRKLVWQGYPASNVLGCDLRQEFIDAGYELYQDRGSCKIHFFEDDLFSVPATADHASTQPPTELSQVTKLVQLKDRINHFYTGAVFHLFNEETQFAFALRVGALLKREKGSIAFGRDQGHSVEGKMDDHLGRDRYAHSPASWARMWKRVFTQLESAEFAEKHVVVDAILSEGFDIKFFDSKARYGHLYWSVKIV